MRNSLDLVVQGFVACYKGAEDEICRKRVDLACLEKIYELVNYNDGLAKAWIDRYKELRGKP
jgi:hypothetical protein